MKELKTTTLEFWGQINNYSGMDDQLNRMSKEGWSLSHTQVSPATYVPQKATDYNPNPAPMLFSPTVLILFWERESTPPSTQRKDNSAVEYWRKIQRNEK